MAEKRARAVRQDYVYGNAAPAIRPERQEHRRSQDVSAHRTMSNTVRRNQEKALYMDLPYVMMLTIAVVCVLFLCVNYLQVQSSISTRIHNIETLEQNLENLKAENDALEIRINTDIDLDHVYQVATQELGMVYANRNQVLLYDKTESEYVRQYEDIPKH